MTECRFRRELRGSRRARVIRKVLPVAAVLLIAAFTWAAYDTPVTAPVHPVTSAPGEMDAPELTGWTKDGRGYSVRAASASTSATEPDLVALDDVKGWMEDGEGGKTSVSATKGSLDRRDGSLVLDGPVLVEFPDGCTGILGSVTYDGNTRAMEARDGVSITRGRLSVTADRLNAGTPRDTTVFSGSVKAVISAEGTRCRPDAGS